MYDDIIKTRLSKYQLNTREDEQDALKEILQETILYALATANFFREAVFCGGTSLRILYDLPRFSEDLDFMLKKPNPDFRWQPFLDAIASTCKEFGVAPEVIDKSKTGKTVQKMFLKDRSIGKILNLHFQHHPQQKLRIKLEIDTNPPSAANFTAKYISFPLDCSISCPDLASNFAGKCHALLCRKYLKGRDWYDFTWYVNRKIRPNLAFLSASLIQHGPWANSDISLDSNWLISALIEKVASIDWNDARNDVAPFLKGPERKTLDLWSNDFFNEKLRLLSEIIN